MPFSEGNSASVADMGFASRGFQGEDDSREFDIVLEKKPESELELFQEFNLKEAGESIEIEEENAGKEFVPEFSNSKTPELGAEEEKVELTEQDIEQCKEGMTADYVEAITLNTKKSISEKWEEPRLTKENESAKLWIEARGASDLKDILDKEKAEKENLEIADVKWNRMAEELEEMIDKQEWKELIPRAGSMNNLDPVKFRETILPLFDPEHEEAILEEVQKARESVEGIGRDINPWELASTIRYVSECFPDLRNRIEFSGKDWSVMKKYLTDVREREWGVKELTEFREKGEYWKVACLERNMEIIQEMIKNGDIKVSEENDIENDIENNSALNKDKQ